jgi:hypothetical protein
MIPSSEKDFKRFSVKYGIESTIADDEFRIVKIKKEDFNKENLIDIVKRIVCKGYLKKDILYYVETEYQEDEYTPGTPMTITIYTEQECTDKRFLKDLDEFVNKIMDIYNGKKQPGIDDMLGIEATYIIEFPKTGFDDNITYFVFLSVENVYEKNGMVYITFGLW